MQNLKLSNSGKSLPFSKGPYKPGQTQSLLSSNLESLSLLGQSTAASADPKGRVLRQVRLSQGLDPSILASVACISLAQLYELEEGLDSRFYSPSLRQQAARKVSRILGLNWDDPNFGTSLHLISKNVIQMQRPASFVTRAAPVSAVESGYGNSHDEHQLDHPAVFSESSGNEEGQSLAVLLCTASADTVVSTDHLPEDSANRQNGRSVLSRVFFVSLLLAPAMFAAYFWRVDIAQMLAWLHNLIRD